MMLSRTPLDDDVPMTDDLARIVVRADSLGFSRSRVATALRISGADLSTIEQRYGLTSSRSQSASPIHRPQ